MTAVDGSWLMFGLLLLIGGALIYRETRGTTLWFDEWRWVISRRGGGIGAFLRPYNEHLSLVPVAIYKVLFTTAGIRNYTLYRAVLLAAHLACVLLIYIYARRRLGSFLALLAAALILFLGAGWEDMLWPFQIAWLISVGSGLGALLALDRGDRVGEFCACGLLAISLASTGVGLAIVLGVAVEIGRRRRWLSDAWIVALPLGLYALWWLTYQNAPFGRQVLFLVPGYVAEEAASVVSSVVGLAGRTLACSTCGSYPQASDSGTLLTWGSPLLIVLAATFVWRSARLGRVSPRAMTIATVIILFWTITALSGRVYISLPYTSRYLYVGGVFIVLLCVEFARGVSVSTRARLVLATLVTLAVVANFGILRNGAGFLRYEAQVTRADLGALEIGHLLVQPGYVASQLPGSPALRVSARQYFAAAKAVGTPAATPAQIMTEPESARLAADTELIRIHRVHLLPAPRNLHPETTPVVDSVLGGALKIRGQCLLFRPSTVISGSLVAHLDVTLPASGVLMRAAEGPATVAVRRYADEFQNVGTVTGSGRAMVGISPDLASQPWHLRLGAVTSVSICGAGREGTQNRS